MRKAILAILVITTFGFLEGYSQTSSDIDSLYSSSLDKTMKFSIIMPSDYDPANQYQVLYLLHGYGANYSSWLNTTRIQKYTEEFPLIVVMPEGETSFFINSLTEPQNRFEDYMIRDLSYYIQKNYSIDTTRQAIAGFSMGGYGALILALKYPDKFWFAASLSGAIMIPRDIESVIQDPKYGFAVQSLMKVYGDTPNEFRTKHDVFQLYKKIPPSELPYLCIISGIQDEFKEITLRQREFADSLRAYGAHFEYHEISGRHNMHRTADAEIHIVLQRMRYLLQRGSRSLVDRLAKTLSKKSLEQAIATYYELRKDQNNIYYLDESELNSLGYELLGKKMTEEAIAIFKLNAETFPKSANVYDSLSDAYIESGNIEMAIKYAEKTLQALPEDSSITAKRKQRIRGWAQEKLKKLQNKQELGTKK